MVHESHGLGIYRGIEKIEQDHVIKDYIKVEYADGGNLYLPATRLDGIQKYAGADAKTPKLNKLGGAEWGKTKTRVRTAVREIAKELGELYAARQDAEGFVYGEDTVWQKEFEEMFPYEETDDQLSAIEDKKKDMESRGRIENVQELKSNILGFLEQDPEDATLSGFLNEIALYTDLDSVEADDNCVTMMTIHSAKGLEFPVVYVVGMEEGIFPGTASMYDEEELEGGDVRTVLHFHPALAPVKIGILPLSKKLNEGAEKIYTQLCKKYNCEFDDRGNIGKRYRRQDEIGTPFCVTYDFESETDGCVTVRFRDSMEQERVAIADLDAYFAEKLDF